MIGNQTDADLAATSYFVNDFTYLLSDEGGSRMVYLINGVVYKVEMYHDGDNTREYENAIRLQSIIEPPFLIPDVSLFSHEDMTVIAMEYIEGFAKSRCYCFGEEECTAFCLPSEVADMASKFINDVSGNNVIETDDAYYLIDLAW